MIVSFGSWNGTRPPRACSDTPKKRFADDTCPPFPPTRSELKDFMRRSVTGEPVVDVGDDTDWRDGTRVSGSVSIRPFREHDQTGVFFGSDIRNPGGAFGGAKR
jgi:hypothetical protein